MNRSAARVAPREVAPAELGSVLVTGGLGFIGRNLARHLAELGADVTVWDLAAGDDSPRVAEGVNVRRFDLRRPLPPSALEGIDTIFHLAGNASGRVSMTDPRFDYEINVEATFNVAEAAIAAGVEKLVFMSSALVYGRPRSTPIPETHPTNPLLPYSGSKLAAESMLRGLFHGLGLRVVIGRCFAVYGRGENPATAEAEPGVYARACMSGDPIVVRGHLDRKTRDFVHVSDVARALTLLAARGEPGGVFNIGTGTEVSLRDLVETLAAVTGKASELIDGGTYWDDSFRHVADVSKLRRLGYVPRVALRDGIADMLQPASA